MIKPYHKHLYFKAHLQVARVPLPSQNMQGRAHHTFLRVQENWNTVLYHIGNCMLHHKHNNLTLRQAECCFFSNSYIQKMC